MTSCEVDEAVEVERGGDCGERKVRWEKLMPRMSMRVLVVESDESTRQLIAGLLKICCYKVMTVSDGLTAWEVLKGKPKSIDLILTEVELPSISGFALLTLIMEHESCKNIPVIMMSKNDSVNMVYKCMLRGAADFLVKPVRKNELQNLWQHVWRRRAYASSEQRLQEKSITKQKTEGLLDNGLHFDDSNGECTPENDECTSENGECSEKGNDAQSSCSVPDLDGVRMIQREDPGWMKIQEGCNKFAEASGKSDAVFNNSTEVIDLIGTFPNHSTGSCMKTSGMHGNNKIDYGPQLDLSLRVQSDNSLGPHNIRVDERKNVVHQSNASAFSRYKASKPINHTQRNTQLMECEGGSTTHISSPIQLNNFHINNSHQNTQMSSLYQESSDLREGELFLYPQLRMLPVPVQVKGARLDRTCTSYSSSLHPSYYSHKIASQTPSPDSGGQREVLSRVMQVPYPNISSFTADLLPQRQDENVDATVHRRNVSSVNERSQNSSLCNNGVISQLNSFGGGSVCGSNGSNNPVEGILIQDENTNRSLLREAALNKFRLKRKDRCFEKKVRYESRKKLAEQRPRVKGQFVRKSPTDASPQLSCKVSNASNENSYRTGSSLVSVCLPNQISASRAQV